VSTSTPVKERDQAEISSAIDEIFGERAPLAVRYAELLCTDGIERGVLGPREAERVWERHILNSAVVATLLPPGVRVVDLGSGAGLPGIPLALARPDLAMVLLEPKDRRVRFLRDCLTALELERVQVIQGRAEDGVTPLAEFVVARAIAPLEALVRLSFELLVDGGALLALKGTSAAGELDVMQRATTLEAELVTLPAPGQAATVVRVVRPARSGRPRRSKQTGRTPR
jgi:16S rRNA (guanine527-N7)-methyltransferase